MKRPPLTDKIKKIIDEVQKPKKTTVADYFKGLDQARRYIDNVTNSICQHFSARDTDWHIYLNFNVEYIEISFYKTDKNYVGVRLYGFRGEPEVDVDVYEKAGYTDDEIEALVNEIKVWCKTEIVMNNKVDDSRTSQVHFKTEDGIATGLMCSKEDSK